MMRSNGGGTLISQRLLVMSLLVIELLVLAFLVMGCVVTVQKSVILPNSATSWRD